MKNRLLAATAFLALMLTVSVNATDPGVGEYLITIPSSVEPMLVKETAENAVHYKFKKSDGTRQFLFSINKVTYQQWTVLRSQLPNARMLGEKNGNIYYADVTNRTSLKGEDKDTYAQAYENIDAILKSFKL